jgi:hypothetical protein
LTKQHSKHLRDELDEALASVDPEIGDIECPFALAGTLEDYLAIRDKYPDVDFPAYSVNYDPEEWIQNLDAVVAIGVSERDYVRAFLGDVSCMDTICLHLLRRIHEFSQQADKTQPIRRQLKESDAAINFLAAGLNEACVHFGVRPPGSLMYLISYRLCGQNSIAKQRAEFRRFAFDVQLVLAGWPGRNLPPISSEEFSYRKVAEAMGVPTSTITRAWPRLLRAWQLMELAGHLSEYLDPPIEGTDWARGLHL